MQGHTHGGSPPPAESHGWRSQRSHSHSPGHRAHDTWLDPASARSPRCPSPAKAVQRSGTSTSREGGGRLLSLVVAHECETGWVGRGRRHRRGPRSDHDHPIAHSGSTIASGNPRRAREPTGRIRTLLIRAVQIVPVLGVFAPLRAILSTILYGARDVRGVNSGHIRGKKVENGANSTAGDSRGRSK